MNVNLAEHQRSILAAMGIDLWVPKVDVQTRHYPSVLYRDIAQNEQESITPFEFVVQQDESPKQNHNSIPNRKNTDSKPQAQQSEVSLLKRNPETQQTEEVLDSAQIQQQTDFEVESALQIEAFELQAYCTEHCVILINSTELDTEQRTLWSNIQRAKSGLYFDLKWPFPLLQFQDGKGAKVYVQGFVDALKQERKIISLGQLPYLDCTDVFQLASLQEMIEQPILKRRLWQFMQNKTG